MDKGGLRAVSTANGLVHEAKQDTGAWSCALLTGVSLLFPTVFPV